ncbi:MAG: hypothetical protein HLUCCO16_14925 [Phormidium sp. OSCR]|nr:MAG: hypothetical protein HLUCCO16_14925 [Phormidium sp. OSCR]
MWRRVFAGVLCISLLWGFGVDLTPGRSPVTPAAAYAANLPSGEYQVQQAQYNDENGEYQLLLLNTPPGQPPLFSSTDVQMMPLTEEEQAAGQRSYLSLDKGQAVLHLAPDFRIDYIHAVTETQTNPQTGQPETVVVRQQSSFWTPFAGALAGQAIGNMLFSPSYYVPPMYQPGGPLTGYGGSGRSYEQAVKSYQTTHNEPPAAVKNRQTLRTTGSLRNNRNNRGNSFGSRSRNGGTAAERSGRSTGSGIGASRLRGNSQRSGTVKRRSGGFGSGRSRTRSGSFGRRRR